jgi:UDP:flavonoid glycosyltransferase YjiC (YdhE family)
VDDLRSGPENVIVVATAPQLELLKRADLCITHAGLNTVLEALGQGVPLLAVPIGYDQPGVAARIAHHRVGEFLEIERLTPRTSGAIDPKNFGGAELSQQCQVVPETDSKDSWA